MTRLIDADAFEIIKVKTKVNGKTVFAEMMQKVLDTAPTIDAEPVRRGKWIIWDEILAGIYHTVSECSECGFTTDKMQREEMRYCPNCGARMDGAEPKE